jgi:predicted nuclease of predicted toxin-antitoxin system
MSQPIKIYTDEQIEGAIIAGLRRAGIDVLTTPEAGLLKAADEVHLARAIAEGRVLLTRDTDFLNRYKTILTHSGIIYARQGISIGDVIHGIQRLHRDMTAEEMLNIIHYIKRNT